MMLSLLLLLSLSTMLIIVSNGLDSSEIEAIVEGLLGSSSTDDSSDEAAIESDVAILGGGIGGIYSAYQLMKQKPDLQVNIFEKNDFFGGRIYDTVLSNDPNNIYTAIGGRRLDDMHEEAKEWYAELGIPIFWTEYQGHIVNTRGIFSTSSTDTLPAYPTLDPDTTDEDDMYAQFMGDVEWDRDIPQILSNSNDDLFENYATMQAYLTDLFGPEGFRFLVDNFRFRADFLDTDVKSYVQFLWHEYEYTSFPPVTGYPEGGLSEVVRRSVAMLQNDENVDLNLNSKVVSINSNDNDETDKLYRIEIESESGTYNVYADYLIINIDPGSFADVSGDIATEIMEQQPFTDAKPIPVSVIAALYDSKWWNTASPALIETYNVDSDLVDRIWTTDNCLNFMEFGLDTYSNTGDVGRGRVSYADGVCAEYWKTLFESGLSQDEIKNEIQTSLQYVYGDSIEVPNAISIDYHYWPNAWHFQKPGANLDLYELQDWAIEPLPLHSGVTLVNEAWSVNKAWIIAPIRGSQLSLKKLFGLEFIDYWTERRRIVHMEKKGDITRSVKKYSFTSR